LSQAGGIVSGGKLPLKNYSIADGLVMDQITVIRQDSRHLLWFGTADGVSWFDGYQFTSYTSDDGLPHKSVFDILETRSGELWMATGNGICVFRHRPESLGRTAETAHGVDYSFEVLRPPGQPGSSFVVQRLVEDPNGVIWCATYGGLYQVSSQGNDRRLQPVDIGLRNQNWGDLFLNDLLIDDEGMLWIAAPSGLYQRKPDGCVTHFGPAQGLPQEHFWVLEATPGGTIWAGASSGLYRLQPTPTGNRWPVVYRFTTDHGLPLNRVLSLKCARDGKLWVGTFGGLASLDLNDGRETPLFRSYTAIHGLVDVEITALAEDREANLWVGTDHGGAYKISRVGFETFDASDGLSGNRVNLVFEDRTGLIVFLLGVSGKSFSVFDGKRFSELHLPGVDQFDWVGPQGVLQDRKGEWWLATGRWGLWRYPVSESFAGLKGRRPSRIYTSRDGLPGPTTYCLYEDSRGDIWVSIWDGTPQLARWNRRTDSFTAFDTSAMPMAFTEDRAGNIWVGLNGTGIVRFRKGEMTHYSVRNGFPPGGIYHLYTDRRGQVWASSFSSGAICIPEPDADRPRFVPLTTRQGLSSNHARFVLEGLDGAFYIGTVRGLDRWDPRTGTIRHFTTNDGLAGNLQNVGLIDRRGGLWLGMLLGISRLTSSEDQHTQPPEVFVRELRLGGIPWPIDQLGQTAVHNVVVPLERNRVTVNFAAVSFASGDTLTYQFRLAGRDSEWQSLSSQRSLDLVDIQPGSYRLELQAINSDGVKSLRPAVVDLTILAPIWRRWWFIVLVMLLCSGVAFAAARVRLLHRLEMERVRTRIATDLHDDIGSSLSQIAILCEVAIRRLPSDPPAAVSCLGQVSATCHSLVDAMSDIVWAINPSRDSLDDLIHRMRRFANDLFAEGNIRHQFLAPGADNPWPVGSDFRRQVYLVYKECLHNLVRHSQATEARIELRLQRGWLELSVCDNGVGFNPDCIQNGGHGLTSLHNRARALGGEFLIESRPGEGTRIMFRVPARTSNWRRRLWDRGAIKSQIS